MTVALLAGPAARAEAPRLSPETIRTTMEAYVAAVNARDPAAASALYDDNASVEDPAGSTPHKGKQAIEQFYEDVSRKNAKLELVTVNPATDDSGTMFFQVKFGATTINVIELMTFSTAGKITSMKAYVAFVPVLK